MTANFDVTNTDATCTDTVNVTASATGGITISGILPTYFGLPPGASQEVTVYFNTSSSDTGTITLTANGFRSSDNGWYKVTVVSPGPVVSLVPHNGDYRDVSKCVANCFDALAAYATPPYFSSDVPHSMRLVYRSSQAHPMGFVQVDAVDTASVNPTTMSMKLYTPQGVAVTFTNGSTEIFYKWVAHPADGNVNRLAAQFDASALSTGAYNYTAAVRSYRADGSVAETDMPVRILIVNEANSPFGAGWSIAGYQRLYPQPNGDVVITEGNGSIGYFIRGTTSNNGFGICTTHYSSPKGDFTTLWGDSACSGGVQLICINNQVTVSICRHRGYPDGSTVTFDPSTSQTASTWDPHGNTTYFGYNASNLLVAITDLTAMTDSLRYDASNHIRWLKDPGGRIDSFTVDASGNLTQITDWAGLLPFSGTYDGNHRLIQWRDRRGGTWGVAYDFAGKLAADTAPQVTANGQQVRPVVSYASLEQKVLINPATGQGTSSNPGPNVDTAAVRATVTNARSFTTTYALNRFGAATLIQEPLGRTTSFTRDSNSAVVQRVSPSGHVRMSTWSGPDMTKDSDATTGRTINYSYTGHEVALISGHTDSVVNVWTGRLLDSTHTGGSGWTKFSYTSNGRLCGIVDPGAHTATCRFNSTSGFQNTDSISYTLGTVRYKYDAHGQQMMMIDQVHDTTRTLYDSIGRVVKTIGPLHEPDSLKYDGLYLTEEHDAKGNVYKTWPNALGWTDSTADPVGLVDHYTYDLNGNMTGWTNRNGRTITYAYDALDQPSSIVADGKTTTFVYDPAGHYRVASDSESVDTLRLDAADRPWLAISCRVLVNGNAPQCFRDSSAYETTNSPYGPRDLQTLTALSGSNMWGSSTQFLIGHQYDVHMLLDSLTPGHLNTQTGQPITFVYSAEALDSVRTLTGLNNLTMTHSYPWTHRTDQVQLSDPTLTAALGTAYYFDSVGRAATRYHGSLTNPDTSRSFIYGPRGDLVQYADSSRNTSSCFEACGGYHCISTTTFLDSTTYTYDSIGNRKDPSAPNGGIGSANRLLRWQNFRMDYDAAGNMVAKRTLSTVDTTKVLRTDSLFWGALGRLDSVRTRDSTGTLIGRVGFGYDGWGRRVRKSTANGTTRYLWDGDSLLAQLDTLGNGVAGYTNYQGIDNVASVLRHDRGDSTYYYVQDYSRNVLALLARTSGGITIDNQYRYDPFGNQQGSSISAVPNVVQFAGREYDADTKLYYDRARYIDPALGRYVSEDPIGLNGGINLYAFVGNDPINGWDPSGTRPICERFKDDPKQLVGEHIFLFGGGLVLVQRVGHRFIPGFPFTPLDAVTAALYIGLIHEGPWWDGDLTDRSKGAPCNGLVDIAAFMLLPTISYLIDHGNGDQELPWPGIMLGPPKWRGRFRPPLGWDPAEPLPLQPPAGGSFWPTF
ncbi:MAG TPA: RHS repeat-associated core domain-containing protein [Gemmatimonadales bacterium]|nr:RHS repeat-associated core domain-containing protein [Gemmatimonadales bacterium]